MKESDPMLTYYVRWRHIPIELSFTPIMYISIEHTQVEAKIGANEYDIQVAIHKYFDRMNIYPEYVRIEGFEVKE